LDPGYAQYFLDVHSIVAVPILYQNRSIGVISVSSRDREAFPPTAVPELKALAASAAKFLRRAQLYREKHRSEGRELLIKGLSPEWLEVERVIERVGGTDAPVLVRGESGTGKELVAHAIHFNSPRRNKPFVVVNAAAIPETLLESTLFGHVRGAYTGAVATRAGQFVKAHGGTLFLDETGDLPLSLQAKLLRAIEQGEITPVGSDDPARRVSVRLICATNRNLEQLISTGGFRSDLYHRISVVTVRLPPLRAYKVNLPVLAQVFVQQANRRYARTVERCSPEVLESLARHDYPGNLSELRNTIDYAVLMATGSEITTADLPAHLAFETPVGTKAKQKTLRELRRGWLAESERRYLCQVIHETSGIRAAARQAGVSPATFYRLLRHHGIQLKTMVKTE
jgi:transcriptional regulator with GAF, ATPase, and Fis domain